MNKLNKLLSFLLLTFSLNGCDVDDSAKYEETEFFDISDIVIEVGDLVEVGNVIKDTSKYEIKVSNKKLAYFEDYYIKALQPGETTLTITQETKRQTVKLNVVESQTYVEPYKFNKEDLKGKNLAVFGDSVTAVATIGNASATYSALFAKHYEMNLLNNYAIGGTTATYTYFGSNIYKEYGDSKTILDGCQVMYKAYNKKELDNVDYAIIAYGHNDQYFKPPVNALNDRDYCTSDTYFSCKSYKGSYRYMINVLKKANPNVKIILLNCTYSEYDKANNPSYGSNYNYSDYRYATKQIAIEMGCKLIDPWEHMKQYYDYGKGNVYYKDTVHLSIQGHKVLADYIISQ